MAQHKVGTIHIVGLGSGDVSKLTLGVWKQLKQAEALLLRTEAHPVTSFLRQEGIRYTSYDALYEAHDTFEETYQAITADVLSRTSEGQHVVYAVPGHPMVAEATVRLIQSGAAESGITVQITGGESFLDEAFLRLGFDPIEGFQFLDAADVSFRTLRPEIHTVIAQVYDRLTASDVKLELLEVYPADHPVVVAHALGVQDQESITTIPLHELDHSDAFGNLSLIYLPRSSDDELQMRKFEHLHDIVRILRSPEGCPWDREQTHRSIRKNLIEETYEVLETIDDDDPEAMCEELGDLLLQVMLHAQMEEEEGVFSVWDVVEGLNRKLIRRHPHVFGDQAASSAEEALQNWQQMKAAEKEARGERHQERSWLSGIPRDLPALMTAFKLQKKAAEVGFDWSRMEDVLAKIEEEINEVREVLDGGTSDDSESGREELIGEIGDLLFAAVNTARYAKVDPEEALALTNRKFIQRFRYIEQRLAEQGKSFADTDLTEMDCFWDEAKSE